MKTIRNIVILMLGAMSVASCLSSVVGDGQSVIRLHPVIGPDVRSGSMSSEGNHDMEFGVDAVGRNGNLFIDNERLSWNGDSWTLSSDYFWKDGGDLRFIAFYPVTLPFGRTSSGALTLESYNPMSSGERILVADTSVPVQETETVYLDFHPVTSRLDFRVVNGLNRDTEVKIEKIVLKGVYTEGRLNMDKKPIWSLKGEMTDVLVYDAASSDPGISYGPESAGREPLWAGRQVDILPQKSRAVIEVTYAFSVSGSGWLTGQVANTEILVSSWKEGRRYTYTLTITETLVKHTVGITDWEGKEVEEETLSEN